MSLSKFPRGAEARLVKDWGACLPSMAVNNRTRLLRRVGPLVVGVSLHMNVAKTHYTPWSYGLNLLCQRDPPYLGLTLIREARHAGGGVYSLTPETHRELHPQAARDLTRQTAIPLAGDVSLDAVVRAYRDEIKSTKTGVELWEALIMLLGWAADGDALGAAVGALRVAMNDWEPSLVQGFGGRDSYVEQLERRASDRRLLRQTLAVNLDAFGLQGVPVGELSS